MANYPAAASRILIITILRINVMRLRVIRPLSTAYKTKVVKKSKNEAKLGIEARVEALEAKVESLCRRDKETLASKSVQFVGLTRHWAIEQLNRLHPTDGGVMYAGHVSLPTEETYAWQIESALGDLLEADWSTAHMPLAALAHPIRLSILKAILAGKRDTQSLQLLPEMGTTGQLYHHLKELESAGWIRQPRRGCYHTVAERVIPLLAILAACEVTDDQANRK